MCTFTSILCTDQWHLHHTCPCYRLGLSSMYIKDSPMKKHVQFLFVNICFLTFFLLYFHGIDKFELQIIPTNVQFIWRCSHLAKLWVDASLWQEINSKPYTDYSMLYLKKIPYLHSEDIKAILNTDQTAALFGTDCRHYYRAAGCLSKMP